MAWPRVVKDQQDASQLRREVETSSLDLEVAAINDCVCALEQLQPESVERVLAYIRDRFKKPYRFEDGNTDRG